MKHLASTLGLLWPLVFLCGCAAGPKGGRGGGEGILVTPPEVITNIAGNWNFSTTSTVSAPPLTFAGSISQSRHSITGAVHVNGSNCFDQLPTVSLTGKLKGSDITLTSAAVAGQVTIFTGHITENEFTGTYTIRGGCADGDQGNVSGIKIDALSTYFTGTFTPSGQASFDVDANLTQNDASPEGSFGLSGTMTFKSSCFNSGIVTPGTFPSGSFVIGTSVALAIQTGNGTMTFVGTENPNTREIDGAYTASGGTCDQTRTAVLHGPGPYDY
jgi:hypothetical protein